MHALYIEMLVENLLDSTYKTPLSSVFLTLEGKEHIYHRTTSRPEPDSSLRLDPFRIALPLPSRPRALAQHALGMAQLATPPLASAGARYMSGSWTVGSILPLAAIGAATDSFPAPFTGGSSCLPPHPSRQRALATPMPRSALDSPTPRARGHSTGHSPARREAPFLPRAPAGIHAPDQAPNRTGPPTPHARGHS